MKNNSEKKFSLRNQKLYPHFKLTREDFPRLLVTRKIFDDGAEYFGAFLPETGVRFLIDFLNKTFRLRTCEIDINGSFDVPCTQFYRKRCVAPCVANLCDDAEYAERVELVRLFLRHENKELEKIYSSKIETAAENFEFEKAADLRDEWFSIEKVFAAKDWNYWLADTVDTFEVVETENEFLVYLVTMRGRKTMGRRAFVFEKAGAKDELLSAVISDFYRFHAPKEIRVLKDFIERFAVADELSKRFNRKIKIVVVNENTPKIITNRAIDRAKFERGFRSIKSEKSFGEIQSELKEIFGLQKKTRRIESFDVAHISGNDFVAAKAVWEDGKFRGKDYEFWLSNESSELETLRKFIEFRFSVSDKNFPDLILIDGGKSHLRAALKGLENLESRTFTVISAVKPPQKHGEIASFLKEDGEKIKFDGESTPHRLLQSLRDEAHNLSNEIHRQRREMSHFYELAAILPSITESERREFLKTSGSLKNIIELTEKELSKIFPTEKAKRVSRDLHDYRSGNVRKIEPLIVPLRYDDENGDAQDLRPLSSYK